MNTEFYRVVLKVAEYGNITKAAENLGYTQPGISNIISRMEEEFNRSIFIRMRNGVMVAPEAESFMEMIQKIVMVEDGLYQSSLGSDPLKEHTLRIGAFRTAALIWLPSLIKDYMHWCHMTQFRVSEKTQYPYIVDEIMKNDLDMGFVVEEFCKDLDFHPLYKDQYCLIMPEAHPLSEYGTVSLGQLEQYPFIVPNEAMRHCKLHKVIQRLNTDSSPSVQMLDDRMTVSMVEQGLGISIVPRLCLYGERYAVQSRVLELDAYRMIGIAICKERASDPIVRKFLRFTKRWIKNWKADAAAKEIISIAAS